MVLPPCPCLRVQLEDGVSRAFVDADRVCVEQVPEGARVGTHRVFHHMRETQGVELAPQDAGRRHLDVVEDAHERILPLIQEFLRD